MVGNLRCHPVLLVILLLWLPLHGVYCFQATPTKVKFTTPLRGHVTISRPVASLLAARGGSSEDDGISSLGSTQSGREKGDQDDDQPVQLDWNTIGKQLALFQQMALPYYKESKSGRWLLAGLLGLTLANSGVSVMFSYLGKDFWNALSAKDSAEFYFVLQKYLGALLVGAPVATFYRFQREQLAVHWREWMTARTFELYASNRVYYNLERSKVIDNPDQRIAEDVNSFTAYSLQLVITMLTSVIDLCSFSTILWSIYPQLFGAIILYAFAGTFITTFLGRSLVSLNFSQLQKEADFRYSLGKRKQ